MDPTLAAGAAALPPMGRDRILGRIGDATRCGAFGAKPRRQCDGDASCRLIFPVDVRAAPDLRWCSARRYERRGHRRGGVPHCRNETVAPLERHSGRRAVNGDRGAHSSTGVADGHREAHGVRQVFTDVGPDAACANPGKLAFERRHAYDRTRRVPWKRAGSQQTAHSRGRQFGQQELAARRAMWRHA